MPVLPSEPMSESPLRAPRWVWLQAGLLALNFTWTTLVLGGYLRETLLASVAFTTLIVALKFAAGARAGDGGAGRWHPAGWWLVPFLVYAGINAATVSPVGWLGWWDWLGWAQLVATFWLALDVVAWPGPRRLLRGTALGLGVVLVALGCYQRFVDADWLMLGRTQSRYFIGRASGAFGIPNSMAVFLALLLPMTLAVALRRECGRVVRLLALGAAGLFALGLVLTVSRGPWLALALALAAWPLMQAGKSRRWRWGLTAGVLGGALAAGALLYAISPGVKMRLDGLARDRGEKTRPIVWRAAWELWRGAPVLGTGAGSYNTLFERHRPERFWDEPQWAHNDYLNTLSDYGAVGFFLCFGGVAGVAWGAMRRRRTVPGTDGPGGAHAVGLLAFALALTVDFHLKMPSLAMLVAGVAADRVGRTWLGQAGRAGAGQTGRISRGLGAVALAGLAVGWIGPQARAEGWRGDARRKIDRLVFKPQPASEELAVLTGAHGQLRLATALDPRNAQAWADAAYAAVLIGRLDHDRAAELAVEAEAAARRALAGSRVVPEFWWRLGVSLDVQGRWADGGEAFARGLRLAPNLPQAWYYAAYHFSLNPATRPMALTAIATCLRLDPWFHGAEALAEELKSVR